MVVVNGIVNEPVVLSVVATVCLPAEADEQITVFPPFHGEDATVFHQFALGRVVGCQYQRAIAIVAYQTIRRSQPDISPCVLYDATYMTARQTVPD